MTEKCGSAPGRRARVRVCPICGKPAAGDSYPFCSPRCADLDLHRWLSGVYVVPGPPEPESPDREDDA